MTPSGALIGFELTDRDLLTIRRLVYEKSGIMLHEGKGALVMARLQKRLRAGGFRSFRQYIRHVQGDESGDEMTALIDAIATNHTSFFREPRHFGFLRDVVLPQLVARKDNGQIHGWSAACATGEEPYTIAMTLFEQFGADTARRVKLLASDLSTKALTAARAGVYKPQRMADVPREVARKYFEHAPGAPLGSMRLSEPIRRLVEFQQLNLLDTVAPRPIYDFIFCRNAMIYFDRPAQQQVVNMLERQLAPGGYLFISHAESLNCIHHGLTWIAPAVYRRSPQS
jgi:chemotaxis protein methyltransferase CheR